VTRAEALLRYRAEKVRDEAEAHERRRVNKARERDTKQAIEAELCALRGQNITLDHFMTNGYVYRFTTGKYSVTLCDQGERVIGSAIFADLTPEENEALEYATFCNRDSEIAAAFGYTEILVNQPIVRALRGILLSFAGRP